MMNDLPDERALAAYEAHARHHESAIELAGKNLAGLQGSGSTALASHIIQLRYEAQLALRVMNALAAAWRRDTAERRACRDQREKEIK